MLKHCFIYILPLLLLIGGSLGATPIIEQPRETVVEKTNLVQPEEISISITSSDLVLDLKTCATEVAIFDITGRAVFKTSRLVAGQLFIARERLPQAPALLLIRIVYEGGVVKTYKVRL